MIYELLQSFGAIMATDTEMRIDCPFCDDTKKHLYFNEHKGTGWCHKCEKQVGPRELLAEFGLSYAEYTSKPDDLKKRIRNSTLLPKPGVDLPDGLLLAEDHPAAYKYLFARGITSREMKTYSIYYAHRGDYAGRIIFPVYMGNKLMSFVARYIGDSESKYLYPRNSQISKSLYGYDFFKKCKTACLVEGVFDYLTTVKTLPTFACFGKHLSKSQVELLNKSRVEKLYLLFDSPEKDNISEEDWKESMKKIGSRLRDFIKCIPIRLPDDHDPNSFGVDNIRKLLRRMEGI